MTLDTADGASSIAVFSRRCLFIKGKVALSQPCKYPDPGVSCSTTCSGTHYTTNHTPSDGLEAEHLIPHGLIIPLPLTLLSHLQTRADEPCSATERLRRLMRIRSRHRPRPRPRPKIRPNLPSLPLRQADFSSQICQPSRPHPRLRSLHRVGKLLAISLPVPPCLIVLPLPRICVVYRPPPASATRPSLSRPSRT